MRGQTPIVPGALRIAASVGMAAVIMAGSATHGAAQDAGLATAQAASEAFASHCFSPFMTAERAAEVLAATSVRVDFYDLDPFSNAAPSPVTGRAATRGTDRRCEVAFDGDHADLAASAAVAGLQMEGIDDVAPVPDRYRRTDGTELLGARFLNPRRIAVVHVGTRPGPNGPETFLFVERMTPLEAME